MENYPFIPKEFKYKPTAKERSKLLKSLYDRADKVINACDSDREGENIYSVLANELGFKKPVHRLWITSHTKEDILKGLKANKDTSNLEKASYVRSHLDWLFGINYTVVFTLLSRNNKPLKVGRVVLPTLKLIYDREKEIENFKSKDYSTLESNFKKNNIEYKGILKIDEKDKFFEKEDNINLEDILKNIKNKNGRISEYKDNLITENAPKLFSLTDLQKHITTNFNGFTADKVLSIAQELYEGGYISYPRTASRYLDDSQEEDIKRVLGIICKEFNYEGDFSLGKNIFNSKKVDSHPALTPTYKIPKGLNNNQNIVYSEIVKRMVANFMEASISKEIELVTSVESFSFYTKEKTIQKFGWKNLYKDKDTESLLGTLKLNDNVLVADCNIKKEKTKPKKHYTESTLLSAMENCGKSVENEEDILKGFSVGTPATRAETINKIVECNYVDRKGKNLLITNLGNYVIDNFPLEDLLSVDFTGRIEKSLKDIELGLLDPDKFFNDMVKMIEDNVVIFKEKSIKSFDVKSDKVVVGICPECGKNVYENSKGFGCEGFSDNSCRFALWKNDKYLSAFGKKLSLANAKKLLSGSKIVFKDLKSKKGSIYTAEFSLVKNDKGYWGYELSFPKK